MLEKENEFSRELVREKIHYKETIQKENDKIQTLDKLLSQTGVLKQDFRNT